ncbi:MAG: HupE/UreJ family protein [Pseudomonadota bacterium]
MRWLAGLLIWLVCAFPAVAHEIRPAHLQIDEQSETALSIRFRQPVVDLGDNRLSGLNLRPVLKGCSIDASAQRHRQDGYLIEVMLARCEGPLTERVVTIEGLSQSLTDVYVTYSTLDGEKKTGLLNGRNSVFSPGSSPVHHAAAYFDIGVHHMLGGLDHVLFVLGLTLLVPGIFRVITVATTFTIAHSLTLGLSVLDIVILPSGPIEAGIALSILYLAYELTRSENEEVSVARRYPELVAFGFGLLHGFGFAGALGQIGLPSDQFLSALFLFNLGVEAGQLVVIALLCLALLVTTKVSMRWIPRFQSALTTLLTVGAGFFFAGAFVSLV